MSLRFVYQKLLKHLFPIWYYESKLFDGEQSILKAKIEVRVSEKEISKIDNRTKDIKATIHSLEKKVKTSLNEGKENVAKQYATQLLATQKIFNLLVETKEKKVLDIAKTKEALELAEVKLEVAKTNFQLVKSNFTTSEAKLTLANTLYELENMSFDGDSIEHRTMVNDAESEVKMESLKTESSLVQEVEDLLNSYR